MMKRAKAPHLHTTENSHRIKNIEPASAPGQSPKKPRLTLGALQKLNMADLQGAIADDFRPQDLLLDEDDIDLECISGRKPRPKKVKVRRNYPLRANHSIDIPASLRPRISSIIDPSVPPLKIEMGGGKIEHRSLIDQSPQIDRELSPQIKFNRHQPKNIGLETAQRAKQLGIEQSNKEAELYKKILQLQDGRNFKGLSTILKK